jgi:predicted  nucleic acid-binding Zn-ribbon protein
MDNIQERDLNLKDILKQKDTYKSQLRKCKRDLTEANKRIKELEKELKKVSK